MTASEIRNKFFEFFERNGHERVTSSSLVPHDDPTLLFTNAGMVQFKDYFLQKRKPRFLRAVTSQKCVRAGGKHNDLENVGRTARHHTFFEMLGNFSFGDYFKEDAIIFAWDFLTKELELPAEKLYITVFNDDDEAYGIWQHTVGLPEDRILRLGEEDNFWSMGDVGPCGPCSEILYDQGESIGCGKAGCKPGCDCDRYLEIWNLVFMQYEKFVGGECVPLKKKCVDTGMGLERITAVMQGVKNNFDCDLFSGVHDFLIAASHDDGRKWDWKDERVSFRVVEDHSRAIAFLVNDGVVPSNEDRGYVLRKIIRRAARHARKIGFTAPVLYKSVGVVIDSMRDVYSELEENRAYIVSSTLKEEERFSKTLDFGMVILKDLIARTKKNGQSLLPGADVFKLYDTYGFPKDLTEEVAVEGGLSIDHDGFEKEMKKQRASSGAVGVIEQVPQVYLDFGASSGTSDFCGYVRTEGGGHVALLVKDDKKVSELREGDRGEVVVNSTVFYPESGGQVGDVGYLECCGFAGKLAVNNTKRLTENAIVHYVEVVSGSVRDGEKVVLHVDREKRQAVASNHTATHILQWALREVLGDHVKQAGSLVSPERLRFDFSHFDRMTEREVERVEDLVNARIIADESVNTVEMSVDTAIAGGATALFGEKYGENVRVVSVGTYSKELCGGTHADSTGRLGYFVITSEGGISAGHRRIEACTAVEAHKYIKTVRNTLKETAACLKTGIFKIPAKVEQLIAQYKSCEKELEKLHSKTATLMVDGILARKEMVCDVPVVIAKLERMEVKKMRVVADCLKDRLKSAVIALVSSTGDSGVLLVSVTDSLLPKLHAGNIVKASVAAVGGKGGGRPNFAQGGGVPVEQLDRVLDVARKSILDMLSCAV